VLREYSKDMRRLLTRGYRAKARPSGHTITAKFTRGHGGAIPPNLIEAGNNDSNGDYLRRCHDAGLSVYPARFPRALARVLHQAVYRRRGPVLDPFAGSNIPGEAAERLGRRWVAVELVEEYLEGSKFRFPLLFVTSGAQMKGR
jgi:site-specific DNA-methyltransferase (cytosine-N4-specific)